MKKKKYVLIVDETMPLGAIANTVDLLIIDLISATKFTRSCEEYADVLRRGPADAIEYIGVGVSGDKTTVNSFRGSLGLLR